MIPSLATLTCCLFWSLDLGVLVGIAASLVLLLREVARPKFCLTTKKVQQVSVTNLFIVQLDLLARQQCFISSEEESASLVRRVRIRWLRPDRGLLFPASAYLRAEVEQILQARKEEKEEDDETAAGTVVLDCRCMASLDFTSAKEIKERIFLYSSC